MDDKKVQEATPAYNSKIKEENLVKKTCKELGITQKELAEKLGVAEATVRNWSGGKETPLWAKKTFILLIDNHKKTLIINTIKQLQNMLKEIKI